MPVSTPQIVTSVFFARPSRFVLSWLASSLTLSRYPSSGWPVTQNPSSSFSPASFSLSVQSGTLGNGTAWSSPESIASPKSPTCPLSLSRCARCPASIAPSSAAHFWLRVPSCESIAPALIRLSIIRGRPAGGYSSQSPFLFRSPEGSVDVLPSRVSQDSRRSSGCWRLRSANPEAADALSPAKWLGPFAVDIRYPVDAAEMLPGDEVRAVEIARFAKAVVLRVLDEG